jgi:hypothetical protein
MMELAVALHERVGRRRAGEDREDNEVIWSSNLESHGYISVGGRRGTPGQHILEDDLGEVIIIYLFFQAT